MHQSYRHESDVTIAPQELPTPAPDSGELTDAELTRVVGGDDGPGGPTDHSGRSAW
jgi:hypothetical protein